MAKHVFVVALAAASLTAAAPMLSGATHPAVSIPASLANVTSNANVLNNALKKWWGSGSSLDDIKPQWEAVEGGKSRRTR